MKYAFQSLMAKIQKGETFYNLLLYWFPELITAFILIRLPSIIDSYLVSNSQSLTSYGAVAVTGHFLYTLIKLGEAIPIAGIALIGRSNAAKRYEQCGEELSNTFWITFIAGLSQFIIISLIASPILYLLSTPAEMITIAAPFLRWKSFGIFLMFILLSFIGFMRAVKNTKIPMLINIIGMLTFIFFDYVLILGKWGFPQLNIYGSVVATIIQYVIMNGIAIAYILSNPDYKKYFQKTFLSIFALEKVFLIINLSWPIIVDKSIFAWCYAWMAKMTNEMSTQAIVSYDAIKNLQGLAFLPAVAAAQVITFLVSNHLGAQDPDGASGSIKKTLILTTITVSAVLIFIGFNSRYCISFFDPHNQFTDVASTAFIALSFLVFLDYIQVILAGALRGAGDVYTVMWGRLIPCLVVFLPLTSLFKKMTFANPSTPLILIYGTYYFTTGIMALIFLYRIKSHKWQHKELNK